VIFFIFQLYIAEISPAKYRGALGSANQLGVTVGVLLAYSLGAGLNWHWLAIAGAVPSTVMAILMLGFPETPRWLIKNGRINEACQVLVFLRKTSHEQCADECKEIQSTLGKVYSFSSRSLHRADECFHSQLFC
jgi:MFS family permease